MAGLRLEPALPFPPACPCAGGFTSLTLSFLLCIMTIAKPTHGVVTRMTWCDLWQWGPHDHVTLLSPPPILKVKRLVCIFEIVFEILAVIPEGGDGHFSLEILGTGRGWVGVDAEPAEQ